MATWLIVSMATCANSTRIASTRISHQHFNSVANQLIINRVLRYLNEFNFPPVESQCFIKIASNHVLIVFVCKLALVCIIHWRGAKAVGNGHWLLPQCHVCSEPSPHLHIWLICIPAARNFRAVFVYLRVAHVAALALFKWALPFNGSNFNAEIKPAFLFQANTNLKSFHVWLCAAWWSSNRNGLSSTPPNGSFSHQNCHSVCHVINQRSSSDIWLMLLDIARSPGFNARFVFMNKLIGTCVVRL